MLQQVNGYKVSTPQNSAAQVSFGAKQLPTSAVMSRGDIVNFLHLDALVRAGEKVDLPRPIQELCQKMCGAKKVNGNVLNQCADHLISIDPAIKNVAETVRNTVSSDTTRKLNSAVLDKCKLKLSSFMYAHLKPGHFKLDKAAAKSAEESKIAEMLKAQGVTVRSSVFTHVETPKMNIAEKYASEPPAMFSEGVTA